MNAMRFCLAKAFDTLWSLSDPFLIMDEQLQALEHAQETAICLAIQFGPKVDDRYDTSSEITPAVLETFHEPDIRIPFPQREVRLLDSARPGAS